MKTTLNLHDFREAFRQMNRTDNFSYEGLEVLFDGLEQYAEETGEEVELDVIALCCDFCEMTAEEIQRDYSVDYDAEDEDGLQDSVEAFLWDNTWVLGQTNTGTYVFREF